MSRWVRVIRKRDWDPYYNRRGSLAGSKTKCPECGRDWFIVHHAIDASGNISPDVECAISGCEFNGPIKLEGWDLGPLVYSEKARG